MRALVAAMGLFTIVPMPVVDVDRRVAARAMAAFPWVGLLLGGVAAGLAWLVTVLGGGALLASAMALAVLVGLTGALHLDGLADTFDGLGSRKPAAEALAIMRQSDIGPMGVVAVLFALLIDVAALSSLPVAWVVVGIVVASMVGRLAVVISTVSTASARTQGFGALFVGATSAWLAVLHSLVVLGVTAGLGWLTAGPSGSWRLALCAAVGLVVGVGWAGFLRRRFGGLTGDTFGAVVEVTTTVVLLAAALAG